MYSLRQAYLFAIFLIYSLFTPQNSWAELEYLQKKPFHPQLYSIENHSEIPPFDRSELPDQGVFSTCYGQVAYFLLQSHHNSTSHHRERLSLVDVINKGSNQEFKQLGHSGILLKKLSHQSITEELHTNPALEFQSLILSHQNASKAKSPSDRDVPTPPTSDLKGKVLSISPYNVHLFDPSTPHLKTVLSAHPHWSQEDLLIREARFLLTLQGAWRPRPIALTFCTDEDRASPTQCSGAHEAILVGSRDICPREGQEPCRTEWKIINSWGKEFDGWFDARKLAQGVIQKGGEFIYLSSCTPQKDCSTDFVAARTPEEFELPGELPGDAPQVFYPLHFLAATGSAEGFQLKLEEAKNSSQMDPLDQIDGRGFLPAHFAASFHHADNLGVIAQLAPLSLTAKDRSGLTPTLLAAGSDCQDCLVKIIAVHPKALEETDPEGNTAAHMAAAQGALQVLKFISERAPSLFYKKNKWNQTPAHFAAFTERWGLLKWLTPIAPETLRSKDGAGATPLKLAKKNQQHDLVQWIKNNKEYQTTRKWRFFFWIRHS